LIGLFANAVLKSGELPSGTAESIDSKREIPAFLMHEIIASLDGYLCSTRCNFDWNAGELLEPSTDAPV